MITDTSNSRNKRDIKDMSTNPEIYIKNLTFSDGTVLPLSHSDIVVFTGPNNVGKSQAIKDILDIFKNVHITHNVITKLESEFCGVFDNSYFDARFKYIYGNYQYSDLVFRDYEDCSNAWKSHSLPRMGRGFAQLLSTESRLILANTTNSINVLNDLPTHPLHFLYTKDSLESELSSLVERAFGEHVTLNRGMGANIALHVGRQVTAPIGKDRVSEEYLRELSKVPLVDTQGDGIRSFIGVLLYLLTSEKSVTLIDEPEAFLHPPQARILGQMLAEKATKQLFVSTHSEDFLKGVIEKGGDRVKVLRITRNGAINPVSILDSSQIKTIWNDPLLKFSNLLSGLFHQKVVICEADTDCRFYQAILDSISSEEDVVKPDVLFTYCGGKERLKVMAAALSPLRVPISVIADFDILDDEDKFKSLCDTMGIDWDEIGPKWKVVFEYVRSQRPQLETSEVKTEVNRILDSVKENHLPKKVNDELRKVLKQSSAWGKAKYVGSAFLMGESHKAFTEIDLACRKKGLFIVPVGQLESFYRSSSSHGTKWVNEVLESVDLRNSEELNKAREFVKAFI